MFSYIQEAMPSGIWLSCTKLGEASGSVDMHFFQHVLVLQKPCNF